LRKLPEWIGKTDDAPIPPRVKLRVFERDKGRCHISGRLIRAGEAWDADHIVALCNGGEHRESNLAPALADKHREKTKADVAEKADIYRIRAKHLGLKPVRQKIASRGFQKAPPQHTASRPIERRSHE
jgi:5-methylcytosine-specific restriction endonuclease McrA